MGHLPVDLWTQWASLRLVTTIHIPSSRISAFKLMPEDNNRVWPMEPKGGSTGRNISVASLEVVIVFWEGTQNAAGRSLPATHVIYRRRMFLEACTSRFPIVPQRTERALPTLLQQCSILWTLQRERQLTFFTITFSSTETPDCPIWPVLLFSKLNKIFCGYFDPEKIF